MNTSERGAATEHFIFARLIEKGFEVYLPLASGSKYDCLIRHKVGRHSAAPARIQIRTASYDSRNKKPWVRLRCSNGRGKSRRYHHDEFDVLISYDPKTKKIYVFNEYEIRNKRQRVSCTEDDLENWGRVYRHGT
jgi:hypothetical protein